MLGGIIGSIASNALNAVYQNYENRKAASKANSYNFGMWQAENEYNKPINQMARLEEAGLNPNLVYGNGATTLSAHSQGAEVAQQRAPDFWDSIGKYMNMRQVDAQTENAIAQAGVATAQAENISAQKALADKRLEIESYNLNWYRNHGQPVGGISQTTGLGVAGETLGQAFANVVDKVTAPRSPAEIKQQKEFKKRLYQELEKRTGISLPY